MLLTKGKWYYFIYCLCLYLGPVHKNVFCEHLSKRCVHPMHFLCTHTRNSCSLCPSCQNWPDLHQAG
ncbi:hypothetical protein XELAEV_18009042mg [Xenopus laevis]|uniref:Uncharacterized protein n=1 Tax=Xenopus laevis TaxID=8355 RepID=A0A974I024_XENLA|nr:hypothetical protein XELAEV_18009042mg [Xenopus laevis]